MAFTKSENIVSGISGRELNTVHAGLNQAVCVCVCVCVVCLEVVSSFLR